jgi:hypothetical protein
VGHVSSVIGFAIKLPTTFPTTPQSASVATALGEESFLFVGETARANLQKMADSLKRSPTRS